MIPALLQRLKDSSGASPASMVLIIPVLVLIVELTVLGGRVAGAQGEVQSAARQASREASFAKGPGSAGSVSQTVAAASLSNAGFTCNSPSVSVGGATDFVPGGQVEVEVGCVVDLSDLSTLPLPSVTLTIERSAIEPIDPYRVVE